MNNLKNTQQDPSKSMSQIRKEKRAAIVTGTSSCSNYSIFIDNRFLCLRNKEKEATRLWEIGKQLGLRCDVEDNVIIQNMIALEDRDKEEAERENKKGCYGLI